MKVLVVGSGGREHALAWKIAQSPLVSEVLCAPGNPGTATLGRNLPVKATDIAGLVELARREQVALTVVGPEDPLVAGLADVFAREGLPCFGPVAAGAMLEGSKAFSKALFQKYGIPSARHVVVRDEAAARAALADWALPVVIKASGLAAGKGVVIATTPQEVEAALALMFRDAAFGSATEEVVIEDFLPGEEVSVLAFTDGETVLPLPPAQDHKRVHDGDQGPNTGGMGAYSPAPVYTAELAELVRESILLPTVRALRAEGIVYRGLLYAGLMVCDGKPFVLEYNCRFGDPETQPLMRRVRGDLVPVLLACATGSLAGVSLDIDPRAAVGVVMASQGYPGAYEKGAVITGLAEAETLPEVVVFQAGTSQQGENLVTSGGRVLAVTALGATIREARARAYAGVERIAFAGGFFRRDIAYRALQREGDSA